MKTTPIPALRFDESQKPLIDLILSKNDSYTYVAVWEGYINEHKCFNS